jgi:hypothetical protein
MGDGSGVRSVNAAANCGDEKAEPGEREPALECITAMAERTLAFLRGKPVADKLR